MKKMLCTVGATAVLAFAANAQAQVYVEGAFSPVTIKDSGYKATPSALTGIVGYEVNPNVAFEGFIGMGVSKSASTLNGVKTGADSQWKGSFGAFVKPKFQVNNSLELFARAGYLRNKFDVDGVTGSESSVAYGAGLNYFMDKQTYVTGGYMRFHDKKGLTTDGLSIGVGYKF